MDDARVKAILLGELTFEELEEAELIELQERVMRAITQKMSPCDVHDSPDMIQ